MKLMTRLLILVMSIGLLMPVTSYAYDKLENAANPPGYNQPADKCPADSDKFIEPGCPLNKNLERLYKSSIPILLWLIILMIIVAGYVYITSGGNADRVKLAKDILGTTMIGAILLLMMPLILDALGL